MRCSDIDPQNSDWNEWRNFVLKELERLNNNYDALHEKLQDMNLEVRELKTKMAMVAAGSSILTSIAVSIVIWLITNR